METMQIDEPVKTKLVTDYSFAFTGGGQFQASVDETVGDTFEETDSKYVITLTAKPSLTDPDQLQAPEVIEVWKAGVVARIVRQHTQRLPTAEEQFDMVKTIHSLVKGLQ